MNMAWQSPSAHAANPDGSNGGGGGGGGGGGQGPQGNGAGSQVGTEYTLQGVMRFLQTEWNRHERDRNSWEIERAEMKARIAKLVGENQAHKRLQQGFLTRIKMLENMLKKERGGKLPEGVKEDSKRDLLNDLRSPVEHLKSMHANLQTDAQGFTRTDSARSKTRPYLEKCLQEISYLLAPPHHPPPPQPSLNLDSVLQQQQQQQQHQQQHQAMEKALMQQQSMQQSMQQNSPAPPNHQPPPSPMQSQTASNEHSGFQPQLLPHSRTSQGHAQYPQRQIVQQQQNAAPAMNSENEKKQGNLFGGEGYGGSDNNPFSSPPSESSMSENSGSNAIDNADSWDFDDTSRGSGGEEVNDILDEYSSHLQNSARRKSLSKRCLEGNEHISITGGAVSPPKHDAVFKVKFALRGHLDVVRAIAFTGGGSPNEPEICTTGDDAGIKRWIIPGNYTSANGSSDVDLQSHFTHRGHSGMVTCLAACPSVRRRGDGGKEEILSDGWLFSGGQDTTVKVWETGRVEAKATLVGHTDAVWALCVLSPPTTGENGERILLASGAADGTVKIWSITPPSPPPVNGLEGSVRGTFRNDGGNASPAFSYSLLQTIQRPGSKASPTCITPMSLKGETFIVSYDDAAVIIFDTATGEEIVSLMSQETYDNTTATGINAVVATTKSLDPGEGPGKEESAMVAGATGLKGGVAGVVITGHEDMFVRIFDAGSGQCTYTMLAHPAAIASLSLSPDGRELVSAGHDASLRFWSLEKRACTQEITSHRLQRGEGVCAVVWSADGKWVVSGGGDGVVKVFSR